MALHVLATGRDLRIPDRAYRMAPGDHLDELERLAPIARAEGAVLAERDGDPCVVLSVAAPWSVVGDVGVRSAEGCVALVCDELPDAPVCPGDFLLAYADVWHGASWSLTPHPLAVPIAQRAWTWAWGSGYGPAQLAIFLERSPAELVDRYAPWPYRPTEHGGWVAIPVHHEIVLRDDRIAFQRAYLTPDPAAAAFDAGLLRALADGALGPLRWDLEDLDYGETIATGETAASLAQYLAPDAPEDELRAAWGRWLAKHEVDARAATSRDDVLACVAASLSKLAEEPRWIEITLRRELGTDWLFERLRRDRVRLSARPV